MHQKSPSPANNDETDRSSDLKGHERREDEDDDDEDGDEERREKWEVKWRRRLGMAEDLWHWDAGSVNWLSLTSLAEMDKILRWLFKQVNWALLLRDWNRWIE